MRAQNRTWAKRFLKSLFDASIPEFDAKPFDIIEERFSQSWDDLSAAQRGQVVACLKGICAELKVDARVESKEDVVRIMLAAAYWSYLIQAFAMELSFDEMARKGRWMEVEELSALPKDDIFEVEDYFRNAKF